MGKADFYERVGLTSSNEASIYSGEPEVETILDERIEILEIQPDPCPMCGADVSWSQLPARLSPVAFLLKHGYFRRCPTCRKEKQVAI